MASALNALPTITSTALGSGNTNVGVGGTYRNPHAVVGLTVPMDSLNFYVQMQDSAAGVLNISATATGTNNSADQLNTYHKGAIFTIHVTSVTVNTVTIGLNINMKNAADGNYYNIYRTSFDGLTASSNQTLALYPGMVSVAGVVGPVSTYSQSQAMLPAVFQVQASLTITTTASMSGTVSYLVGMSKVL